MRVLTVQQPWAWAIIHGGKDVENRTQAWSYRGPLVIHAGLRLAAGASFSAVEMLAGYVPAVLAAGRIIGTVDLVDVHHVADSGGRVDCCTSRWAEPGTPGRWHVTHLVLQNPRPLRQPVACRGTLGLWRPSPDLLARIECQTDGVNG